MFAKRCDQPRGARLLRADADEIVEIKENPAASIGRKFRVARRWSLPGG